MRAIGLFLLLAGCLVLLWPWYGHLVRVVAVSRADTQLYGGTALMAGILALLIWRAGAR